MQTLEERHDMPLKAVSNQPTMTSREIAELTGKEHRNVLRDLDVLRNQLGELFVGSAQTWTHPQNGQRYPEYVLDKDTTLCLVAGYDAVVRMRIIKRWQELEAQQAPKLPQTMAQALRLAADQAEQLEQQAAQLALAAPKVEYVDRYVAANGAMGFRQVAKLLNAKEPELRAFLEDHKILYRLAGVLTPYQNHIEAGRFSMKTGVSPLTEHAFAQARFTPKGVEWVAGLWGKHQAKLAQAGEVMA